MSNKKTPASKIPKVSKLPLPVTDSPLVIDLPDGQKLVIGKMSQGNVIEVATWRGTGRPDSRTSRLMLGMSSNAPKDVLENKESEKATEINEIAPESGMERYVFFSKKYLIKFWSYLKPYILKIVQILKQLLSNLKRKDFIKFNKINKPKEPRVTIMPKNQDTEVDAWLKKIVERAEKSASEPVLRSTKSVTKKNKVSSKSKVGSKRKVSR